MTKEEAETVVAPGTTPIPWLGDELASITDSAACITPSMTILGSMDPPLDLVYGVTRGTRSTTMGDVVDSHVGTYGDFGVNVSSSLNERVKLTGGSTDVFDTTIDRDLIIPFTEFVDIADRQTPLSELGLRMAITHHDNSDALNTIDDGSDYFLISWARSNDHFKEHQKNIPDAKSSRYLGLAVMESHIEDLRRYLEDPEQPIEESDSLEADGGESTLWDDGDWRPWFLNHNQSKLVVAGLHSENGTTEIDLARRGVLEDVIDAAIGHRYNMDRASPRVIDGSVQGHRTATWGAILQL
jgi:hypothetical protein